MKIVYHPDAEEELLDGVRFYQQRVPGLGERFLRQFDAAISKTLRADQQGLTIRSKSGMAAIERSVPGEYPAETAIRGLIGWEADPGGPALGSWQVRCSNDG